ncbi:STAS domain-containing protein [Solirubrobacter sp. CPCC 204708]|uniref:STAS domain-containing protein n=1 Tax=Solirubrobacter deserti TaxID=2282478 RepID=A0ABT4RCG0_9ACTN|nr:STAS domain-containing protein [Solirubrobacter deserti]MBE2315572.1 STAS domain-containing protein [Solirubrobacter deserti]MDA0136211.1 STAS domain-containing protein [Solirubrobacter deserti]
MSEGLSVIQAVLREQRTELLDAWVQAQLAAPGVRTDLISESELRVESDRFLTALAIAVTESSTADTSGPAWDAIREQLTNLSRTRATRGFTPTETATFVFSFKEPLFGKLPDGAAIWAATQLIDNLGLFTAEAYLRTREDVIRRQQDELIELSTPVVKLWQGVVALPLIGTLDSARTQVVMESLLQKIVETDSAIAIIDITGVPTVDTMVAQHLLKAVTAARLMGADCIISGIRPLIAQTIVHLGLDLSEVTTKSSLADAVTVALERTGHQIVRRKAPVATAE